MNPFRRNRRFNAGDAVVQAFLLVAAGVHLVPFLWLVCATFKRPGDLFQSTFLPWHDLSRLTLANLQSLLEQTDFLRWMLNSLFLASLTTLLSLIISSLAGFALARYAFRGRRLLMAALLLTLLIPSQVILPGSYELISTLGWMDTYRALILPSSVSVLGAFLFFKAMRQIPDELLQAGRMDGCGELRLWWEIALPAVRPVVGAFVFISFLGHWNNFLWPSVILQDETKFPLSVGLANLLALPGDRTDYATLMAGTLLALVPPALLFFLLQRDWVQGLAGDVNRE